MTEKELPLSPFVLAALIGGSVCASVGSLMLKAGATGRTEPLQFLNVYVVAGLALYALGSVLWIFCMSKAPLTVVYPFTALSFIFIFFGAIVFQGERPAMINMAGVLLVVAGIGLVMWGRQ